VLLVFYDKSNTTHIWIERKECLDGFFSTDMYGKCFQDDRVRQSEFCPNQMYCNHKIYYVNVNRKMYTDQASYHDDCIQIRNLCPSGEQVLPGSDLYF